MADSMVFYDSFKKAIDKISDPLDALATYEAIIGYALTEELPDVEGVVAIVFDMAKPQIDANIKRREDGKKGGKFGSLGGRPRKNPIGVIDKNPIGDIEENPNGVSKKTPNVNVNVNDNVNVNVNNKRYKHTHGQFQNVKLTQEEYDRLVKEYGQQKTDEAIEFLSAYMQEKAYKTKNHNLTLRRWVFKAVEERKEHQVQQNAKIHNFEERRYDASAFDRLVSN